MCEASPPSHPPRGPCGTLADAERVVAAARIAALRARLGTDDGGGGGNAAAANGASPPPLSRLPLTSSSPPPPPVLARVHPSVRLFVGGVSSARCLSTLRANGVTHVVNATTCLPHFHEGRALVEEGVEGEEGERATAKNPKAKAEAASSSSSPSPFPSSPFPSSFSYLRVPIYDDASQDLGPHLECALAFIDAGLSFPLRGGKGSRGSRRRHEEEEENEDADDDGGSDLDLDFDFGLDPSSPPSSASGGGGVLIHCVGGVSRSAALAAAWLVSRAGATAEGAVAAVRRARPLAAPNSGFSEQLRGLEARVAAARERGAPGRPGRESDREFSRRLAALLAQPGGAVVVSTTSVAAATRPISVPTPFGKRRSSSTLALSLLPSPPVAEEAGIDSDASAKSTFAVASAADDDALPPRPEAAAALRAAEAKRMPRATSALLQRKL